MKFNQLTYNISLGILVITALYTLVYSGLTGILMVSAVGLLSAAFLDELEVVVAVTVLFAMFYTLYMKRSIKQYEPYVDADEDHFKGMEEDEDHFEPSGVLSEGFADAASTAPATASTAPATAPPAASTPAPANPLPANNAVANSVANTVASALSSMGANAVPSATAPSAAPSATAPSAAPSATALPSTVPTKVGFENQSDEFQSATGSLFKLGKMPSEHAEGPRLDAGQTIMKAMSSFDPKTISAMTTDTKKLLETQKGLMQMLTQMRPVLADGKELLNTFTGMFGGGGAVVPGAM